MEKHGGVGSRQGACATTSSGCFVYFCRNAGRSITLCLAAWLMDRKHNVHENVPRSVTGTSPALLVSGRSVRELCKLSFGEALFGTVSM